MGGQIFDENMAKRRTMWSFNPKDVVVIGLDTKDGPEHELYDERILLPLDEAMVLNIMALGVREPVVVRKGVKGRPEVVDGRRRAVHAREANRRLAKAGEPLVRLYGVAEEGDETYFAKVAISLNEIRHDDPLMTKVDKCQRLLQRNGNDIREAAVVFGVTRQAIKQWIRVGGLAKKVKAAVSRGEISASAAAQLSELTREDQVKQLDKLLAANGKDGGAKDGNGKKKKVNAAAVKRATGRKMPVGKRVLMKLINDEALSAPMHAEMILGMKIALGEHIPDRESKLGKLLEKVGYRYA